MFRKNESLIFEIVFSSDEKIDIQYPLLPNQMYVVKVSDGVIERRKK